MGLSPALRLPKAAYFMCAESGSGLRPKTPPPFGKGGRKLPPASALPAAAHHALKALYSVNAKLSHEKAVCSK